MALQRINRVMIRDVRSWRGEHEFTFDEDITVLYGPNGSGKSSLWIGIVLGLLFKISSSISTEIRSIGGGSRNPYVEVDFTANGIQYRIEKTFGIRSIAAARLLNLDSGELLCEQDAAVIECRNLLTGSGDQEILGKNPGDVAKALEVSTKGQIVDLILPKQGNLNQRPEKNKALSMVGLKPNAESQNSAMNAMIAWVEEDRKSFGRFKMDGEPAANAKGDLIDAMNKQKIIAAEEDRLIELSNNLQTLIRELNELELELEQEESEDNTRTRIDGLRREADSHQVSRDKAEKTLRDAEQVVQPLQNSHIVRLKRRDEAQSLTDQNTQLNGQLIARKEAHAVAEKGHKTRTDALNEVNIRLAALNEWIQYAQRLDSMESQRKELRGLEVDRDLLTSVIDSAAEIQTELDTIVLATDEQWTRIKAIAKEVSAIRGAADAWSITEFSSGKEHRIFIDEDEIEKAPDSVNTSIEVRDSKGNTKIRVENTTSLSKIQELEEEERAIFSALSAKKGTLELRKRQIRHDELSGKLSLENSRIKDLNNRMAMDDRIEMVAQLTAQLESTADEPETDRPEEGDWTEMLIPLQGERDSAQSFMEESVEVLQNTRDKLTEITAQSRLLRSQIDDKSEEISAHIEAFGEDEVLQTQLAEARVRLQEAKEVAEPLIEARDANEEQKRIMAQTLQDQLTGEQKTRTRMVELQTTIRDRRTTSGLGELSNVSTQRETLDSEITSLRVDFSALQALETALNSVRDANIEAIRPHVENTIQNGATYVFAREVQIKLGDDGFPQAVEHVQGQAIPFEQESFGTQEQLNLIYRIALAGIIAEEEGHGLCIVLDDPFGDTDIGRRQRMIEWMGAELRRSGHQLILLTCRGSDFRGFGHHDDIRQH
ncbi:MAG: AAA family ATPase [Flavobacteriales bacterium]|jgi:hypothetical protein|nr:AAA family ATPase [Flavobacteriales bacterium]